MNNGQRRMLIGCGLLLVLLQTGLLFLSRRFEYDRPLLERPQPLLVALLCLSGALYLAALPALRGLRDTRNLLLFIFLTGLIMRVPAFCSTPMHEDDWYRYLWDGALTANGLNPYRVAPRAALDALDRPAIGQSPLARPAAAAGVILRRVNHPELRTIYPPVTQATFTLAHCIAPFQLWSWRLVLLLFDCGIAGLLLLLLRRLRMPAIWLTIYWWNPLLLKEVYNSAHMEPVTVFFTLLALLAALKKNHLLAFAALALAVGSKVWPLILLPVLIRPLCGQRKTLLIGLAVFGALLAVIFYPILQAERQLPSGLYYRGAAAAASDSGFGAYADKWEMNDALFMGLVKANEVLEPLHVWLAQRLGDWYWPYARHFAWQARLDLLILLILLTIFLNRRAPRDEREFCARCLWISAWLFLLGPTQFPWYFLWLLPLLTLRPRLSLLAYTALLPLYYLRFYYSARGQTAVFDYGIVWVEHLPVLILLALEYANSRNWLQFKLPAFPRNENMQ